VFTETEVQEMGRPKSTIRISLKGKDGKSVRLNLLVSDYTFILRLP
jgi:hypothetical protein